MKERLKKLEVARDRFVERLAKDRHVLAAVQVGSFADEVLWKKESVHLWVIEEDGVARRLKSDGEEPRIFRTFCEEDVQIHVEVIPRSRFKLMVEGSSRTAFSCSFFARRTLVHSADPSIKSWFEKANELATRDQKREVLAAATWVLHSTHHAHKVIDGKKGLDLLLQDVLWMAHGLAAIEIISRGEICEGELVERAFQHEPALYAAIYTEVLARGLDKATLLAALERVEAILEANYAAWLEPLLAFLKKQARVVPFSEIAEHFAHSQLWPGHLEEACEWLARHKKLERVSAPFRLTKKSKVELEEPAYLLSA